MRKYQKKEQRKMKINMSYKIREICTVKERSVLGMRESGKTVHFMPLQEGLTLQEQMWVLNRDW